MTVEVEKAAEACVVAALRKLHFTIVLPDGGGHGAAVINAWKARQHILVQMVTTISPAQPRSLTFDEEQSLCRQAASVGGQAWEAQVLLSSDLELVNLEWRPLELGGSGMGGPHGNRDS